jgi:hypothetical protein
MALVLDSTPGGSLANSYASLAEAESYHLSHAYPTVWEDANDDERNRALVMATRLLDTLIEWDGWVATPTQALLWPRAGLVYPNRHPILATVIPEQLKWATAEFARQLLSSDRTADSDAAAQGLTSVQAGPVTLTFNRAQATAEVIPDAVFYMVAIWGTLRRRGGNVTTKLERA